MQTQPDNYLTAYRSLRFFRSVNGMIRERPVLWWRRTDNITPGLFIDGGQAQV
ncbi:MAG TPA: hypothetical protein VNH18_00115 [Bryobacteraceae bacterium]|nr:hypothetical protein [Bryobacteraceae bacterium]